MLHIFILFGSITGKSSVIDKPFSYSHHQRVTGLIFDGLIILALVTWALVVWYRNFGPGARRRAAAAGTS
ncbi:MAG TPA: hypothetical protein VGK79_11415 [Gaiellaceae bacterium]|jgi:hypothetical protein